MKKRKLLIVSVIIALLVLIFPIRIMRLKDGGSVTYKTLLFEITKIHQLSPIADGVKPYIDGYEIKVLGMRIYRKTDEAPASSLDNWKSTVTSRQYIYEKGSFGDLPNDTFYINIHNDGTFEYYEGMLSSYIGTRDNCTWELKNDILILTDSTAGGTERINYFKIDGNSLIFKAENSTGFIHTKVADGDKFNLNEERERTIKRIVNKRFVYENNTGFIIDINDNGRFHYSENSNGSLLNNGVWIVDNDTLTLVEKFNEQETVNYFKVIDNGLIFQADISDNFKKIKIKNGEKFIEN